MQKSSIELKINKEYEKLVPPLTTDERRSLKDNIKEFGQLLPIIVSEDGTILDGHHRYRICEELGVEPQYVVKKFDNLLYEKLFVIDSNLQRRQLNNFQRVELELMKEPILKEIAKEISDAKIPQKGEKGFQPVSSKYLEPIGGHGISDEVGKRAGVSHETVRKVKNILNSGNDKVIDSVRSGKTSISYGDKSVSIAKAHKPENIPKLPEGKFDIILADPPWSYDINTRGSPDEHYDVMDNQKIMDLQIPASDNAVLFLWATFPKLKEALDVMESWGFDYKTAVFVWKKDKIGTGYYSRAQCELCLLGEKGGMPVPQEKDRPNQFIESPRQEHSKKPDIVYDYIERMYPNRSYLELFARKTKSGWKSWGNELA